MEKSADAFRTISEVAEVLETPAHVLRFWESRFPQIKPVKRAGGRRYYRPNDVALLTGIKRLLHDEGMTIRGVQKILREQGVRHVAGLTEEPSFEEEALEAAMMDRLDAEVVSRPADEIETEQAAVLEAALDDAPDRAFAAEPAAAAPATIVRFPGAEPPVQPMLDLIPPEPPEDVPPAPMAVDVEPEAEPTATIDSFADHWSADAGPAEEAASKVLADLAAEVPVAASDQRPDRSALSEVPVSSEPAKGSPAPDLSPAIVDAASAVSPDSPEPVPDAATQAHSGDTPAAEEEPVALPLPNRLRALPRTALANRQPEARALLARMKALRDRMAAAQSGPRT